MGNISEYRRRQASAAGQKAFRDGKARATNNRQRGTIYYDDWMDGWDYASYEADRP